MYKYFIEAIGVAVIVTAKLLTEANPIVMGLIYFATLWMTQGITTGFLTPFGPIAYYMLGQMTTQDAIYNLIAQIAGALSAVLLFKPIKTFIE